MRARLLLLLTALCSSPAQAEWLNGNQAEIHLQGNGSTWTVPATLNGTARGTFLLDTGATYCVVSKAFAQRLRLDSTSQKIRLQTANGIVTAPVFALQSVEIGGSQARNVPTVVHDAIGPSVDGIIGLSFLNNFTYAVDSRRRVLQLR